MRKARRKLSAVRVDRPEGSPAASRAPYIDAAAAVDADLEQLARERRRKEWLRQNSAGIRAYNRGVEKYGCFGDGLRGF
jgi:post-segregation antitoxin (ccd killing protein)